jgi:hypothetical protein
MGKIFFEGVVRGAVDIKDAPFDPPVSDRQQDCS